jgi:predicted transcriptional regulator
MRVRDLVERYGLEVAAGEAGLDREVSVGHCGDLLSEVIANAVYGSVWITVQGHQNIVAVAVLRDISAVVIASGNRPDKETCDKADAEGIPLLTWKGNAYELAGKLYNEGLA